MLTAADATATAASSSVLCTGTGTVSQFPALNDFIYNPII